MPTSYSSKVRFLTVISSNRTRFIPFKVTPITRFRPGLWLGGGLGYGVGARSTINDVLNDDRKENLAWIVTLAYPISPKTGFKVSYVGIESLADVGADSHCVAVAMSVLW